MIRTALIYIVYIVAIFLMIDSCYIVLIPKDKYWACLEASLAGFFIFSIVVLSDKEKIKK